MKKIVRILQVYSTKFCNKLGRFQYVNNFAHHSYHYSLLKTCIKDRKIHVKKCSIELAPIVLS